MPNENSRFNYNYSKRMKETDQLIKGAFIQIPMVLFTSDKYKTMSNNCRAMYGLLQSRWRLSVKNNWVDKRGDIYFVYGNKQLVEYTGLSERVVIKCKKELANLGLLEEERTGVSNRIYLLEPDYEDEDLKSLREYQNLNDETEDTTKLPRRENGRFIALKLENNEVGTDEKSVLVEKAPNQRLSGTDEKSVLDGNLLNVSSELTKSQSSYSSFNYFDTKDTRDTKDTSDQFQSDLSAYLWENLEESLMSRTGNILNEGLIRCFKIFAMGDIEKVENWNSMVYKAKSQATNETGELLLAEFGSIDYHALENTIRRALTKIYKGQEKIENPDGFLYRSIYNSFIEMADRNMQARGKTKKEGLGE